MNLHLIDGSAGLIWNITGPISFAGAILCLFIGLVLESKRARHIVLASAVALAVLFGISIAGSIVTDNAKTGGNLAAIKDGASNAYGLQLSDKQARNLLGKAGLNGDNNAEQFGSTLLVKGNTVQKVQLVHPGNRWLIIDAGTRAELTHD
jgi:hypothetical protein